MFLADSSAYVHFFFNIIATHHNIDLLDDLLSDV